MPGITKSYRLTADGSQVKREFGEVGRAGEDMERKIRDGAKSMSPALRALDAAAGELRGKMEASAGAAGGLGAVLRSVGPAGFAAAAGVGALILGFNALSDASRSATNELAEIYVAAHRLNTSVEFLQEWRFAMVKMGEDARIVDATLSRFAVKLGQLTTSPANELRQKLSAFGFTAEDLAHMRTIEEALPIIADRIRDVGTAAEDASLLEALGLKEMQALLQQGSDRIEAMRRHARELGIVLDEETLSRAHDLDGAWEAAAYALDITFKQAMIDAAPLFIETLRFFRDLASAVSDFADQFQRVEERATGALGRRLDDIARERARLREAFPRRAGEADPLAGGSAAAGANAHLRGGALGLDALGATFDRTQAANRLAYLNAEAARLAEEINAHRTPHSGGHGSPALSPVTPAPADPRISQAEAMIERLREEARAREDLLALQHQFPGASQEELNARRALMEQMRQLAEARALGVIGSDDELAALKAAAHGNHDYAESLRAAAEAQRELNAVRTQVESFRRSVETPEARRAREEAELNDLYARSQSTNDPITTGELERGLRRIREEYEKIGEAQYEASLEGQMLRGIIEGQIRSLEDFERLIVRIGADSVVRELLAGGLHGEGGFSGFFRRTLNRFGDSLSGREGSGLGDRAFNSAAEDGVAALADAAKQAGVDLASSLSPSAADAALKLGVSATATAAETAAKSGATAALAILAKSASAAAAALASVAASGGGDKKSGLVNAIVSAAFKGGGRASGGPLFPGLRHPYAEGGQPELLLLGGSGHVLPNETLQGIVSLSRMARQAPAAGTAPRVSVVLRDQSGAKVSVDDARAEFGADGGLDIELVLGRHVAGQIAQGRADRALRTRFGLKPPRVRRG